MYLIIIIFYHCYLLLFPCWYLLKLQRGLEAHRFITSGFDQRKPRDTQPKRFAGGGENK